MPESPASPAPGGYGGPVPPGGWQQPLPRSPQLGAPPQGQLAGWGGRLGAYLIDFLIIFVPFMIIFFVLIAGAVGITGTENEDVALGGVILAGVLSVLVFGALALLYAPLLMRREGEHNGQTWGKQVVGIRAVRD
ncbi:MAG: RDD family protein, partial [Thermoleophilaceae bacterium]|nr:RDD family protein [Thermoleophilaceae bacterium]